MVIYLFRRESKEMGGKQCSEINKSSCLMFLQAQRCFFACQSELMGDGGYRPWMESEDFLLTIIFKHKSLPKSFPLLAPKLSCRVFSGDWYREQPCQEAPWHAAAAPAPHRKDRSHLSPTRGNRAQPSVLDPARQAASPALPPLHA